MSEQAERHPITLKKVRYTMPGVDAATIRRDVAYKAGDDALTMDVLPRIVGQVLAFLRFHLVATFQA